MIVWFLRPCHISVFRDGLFCHTNFQGNKYTKIAISSSVCRFRILSRPKLWILINLLNTEITKNLELQDWILAKCDEWRQIVAFLWESRNKESAKVQKLIFYFQRATLHIPLTKSATLNMLLHCSLWHILGVLFWFSRALFLHFGGKIALNPRVFPLPPLIIRFHGRRLYTLISCILCK